MSAHQSDLIATDIDAYLYEQEHKDLLRFITCGSVDDGKSTLIGRMLYESKMIFEDQMSALAIDSKKSGTQGGELDFALLVDGLAAEREQGITIDVAYRFFSTSRRKFIVADTPGHEQYTRNMVTGASTADLAVILVDARSGILTQTRRHSYLVSLLGIRHVVLAVNKLDLVGYDQATFERIEAEYRHFAAQIGLDDIVCIPISALRGDNLTEPSAETPWYAGPPLMEHLETVSVHHGGAEGAFRLPVQWVIRPDLDFRGFAGTIVGGSVRPGDPVRVLPSGRTSTIGRIVTFDGDRDRAVTDESITVTLTDEIDVSRGDLLVAAGDAPAVADRFQAHLVWMSEEPLAPGRPYLLKCGTQAVPASVSAPDYAIDVNSLQRTVATTLELNEIGVCTVRVDRPIAFDSYADNRDTGGFILIDRVTNATVAAGMIDHAARRSTNIHWQSLEVGKDAHVALKGHRPAVVWLTGLSGSGKSTIANLLERRLHAAGVHTYLLDGDNIRHGLNSDLGFSEADRRENIRRVAEVARLMVNAGLVVIVAFISPFRAERELARSRVEAGEFFEIFVDTPLDVAEQRDPKGLYRKARAGELPNFTGIDSPYEAPAEPELRIDTTLTAPTEATEVIVARLTAAGIIPSGPAGPGPTAHV
jgi:bifunctional enzyme CysN/CysC